MRVADERAGSREQVIESVQIPEEATRALLVRHVQRHGPGIGPKLLPGGIEPVAGASSDDDRGPLLARRLRGRKPDPGASAKDDDRLVFQRQAVLRALDDQRAGAASAGRRNASSSPE